MTKLGDKDEETRTIGICGKRIYEYCEDGCFKKAKKDQHPEHMSADEDGDEADEFFEVTPDGRLSSKGSSRSNSPPSASPLRPSTPIEKPPPMTEREGADDSAEQQQASSGCALGHTFEFACTDESNSKTPAKSGGKSGHHNEARHTSRPRGRPVTPAELLMAGIATLLAREQEQEQEVMQEQEQDERRMEKRRRAMIEEEAWSSPRLVRVSASPWATPLFAW